MPEQIKTVGLFPNRDKDPGLEYTNSINDLLIKKGKTVLMAPEDFSSPTALAGMHSFFSGCDAVVVLGGDGTMLRASHYAAEHDKPLIGINLGNLGYLTDAERSDGHASVEAMLNGAFRLERRMMLRVDGHFHALNDVCITRGPLTKMIGMELYVNNEFMDVVYADGVVISTPTGSTAYNLSAGGPILKPDSAMIAITVICPHSLYTRPWVIDANDIITVKLVDLTPDRIDISADGNRIAFTSGDGIRVGRSEHYTTIMKTKNTSFYDVLRQKMVIKANT